jgi:hypothetical protein
MLKKKIWASFQRIIELFTHKFVTNSVADFHPSRSPDPKTATKERGEKICCHNFLCSHKFHKVANYFSFEVLKKKIWANFQRIIELYTQKIVTKLSKIWIWDPGSGKNLFRIPDPQHWSLSSKKYGVGIRYAGSGLEPIPDPGPGVKRHWIPDPGPQHCL